MLSGPNGATWVWNWTVPTDVTFTTDATVHLYVKRRGTCASGDVEYLASLSGSVSGALDSTNSGNINVDCDPVGRDVILSVSGSNLVGGETLRLAVEVVKVAGGNADKSGLALAYDGFDFDSYLRFEVAQ